MQKLFRKKGIKGHVLDITPDQGFAASRGSEINLWLTTHPGCTSYLVVDDNLLGSHQHDAFFVQTNTYFGFDEQAFQKAMEVYLISV
jgi:hypothetical protein